MKKLILSMVSLMMIAGCGADTNVDARCQAGAPCNYMTSTDGYTYWEKHFYDDSARGQALWSGDPGQWQLEHFENWYYTGKE